MENIMQQYAFSGITKPDLLFLEIIKIFTILMFLMVLILFLFSETFLKGKKKNLKIF